MLFCTTMILKPSRVVALCIGSLLVLGLISTTPILAQGAPTRVWTGSHLSTVATVAMSPDGAIMASGSYDLTIKLWRVSDGALLRTLPGHLAEVRSVAFSPDGSMLVSGSSDRTVKIWRVSDGLLLRTLIGHSDVVRSVAFSPDSSTVLSGAQDRNVLLWRVSDGLLLRNFSGNANWVMSVAYSPDGTSVISGGTDGSLMRWRVADGVLLWGFAGHADWVMSVAYSPDGSTIASGGLDFTTKLWRASDGALLRTITDFGDGVNCVTFSRDGSNLMTADWKLAIKKWRVADGALLQSYLEGSLVSSVCFTPDNSKFGYGLGDGKVVLALNSSGGGTTTPALDVVVSTAKPAYVNREKAAILASVTDGVGAVAGATVSVVVTSPKGTRTTLSGSTAANGVVTVYYTVNSTKQGVGTYRIDASTSKSGYTAATDSTTFLVTK